MNINSLPNNVPKYIKDFFHNINDYLDTELYFYGSITRGDYIPDKSDIDVMIFTDNEYSTISKLQQILHAKRKKFRKVVWKLNGQMIYGYKIETLELTGIQSEIAIYNTNFKELLMGELLRPLKNQNPIINLLLYILKFLYYKIEIIPNEQYKWLKRKLLNDMMGQSNSKFLLIKEKEDS